MLDWSKVQIFIFRTDLVVYDNIKYLLEKLSEMMWAFLLER